MELTPHGPEPHPPHMQQHQQHSLGDPLPASKRNTLVAPSPASVVPSQSRPRTALLQQQQRHMTVKSSCCCTHEFVFLLSHSSLTLSQIPFSQIDQVLAEMERLEDAPSHTQRDQQAAAEQVDVLEGEQGDLVPQLPQLQPANPMQFRVR